MRWPGTAVSLFSHIQGKLPSEFLSVQGTADHSLTSKRPHHICFAVLRKHTHTSFAQGAQQRKLRTRTLRRLCIFGLLPHFPSSSYSKLFCQDGAAYPEFLDPCPLVVDNHPFYSPRCVHRPLLYSWTSRPGETSWLSVFKGYTYGISLVTNDFDSYTPWFWLSLYVNTCVVHLFILVVLLVAQLVRNPPLHVVCRWLQGPLCGKKLKQCSHKWGFIFKPAITQCNTKNLLIIVYSKQI